MWEEGPEIEYDRVKAGLTTLLTKEVARREAAAKAAAKKAKADKEGALSASKLPQRPATVGGRIGVLTFHGPGYKQPPPKRPTEL